MNQSRKHSIIESCVQTGIAFTLSVVIQPVIFRLWDIHINHVESIQIAIAFTIVSFIRSYIVRRGFVWFHHKYPYK